MFHKVPLKLYFMEYSERKNLHCILPFIKNKVVVKTQTEKLILCTQTK